MIGVQWHPEKMIEYDENANRLWHAFMEEAKKNKFIENKNMITCVLYKNKNIAFLYEI